MPERSGGRQRYRWLVLLASAVILLVWMLVPAPRDGADPSGASGPASSSPVPSYDATDVPTTFPSTPPATGDPDSGLPTVRLVDLPPEASQVVELIDRGGPFGEDEDGSTFENREDLLPDRPRGYYREYTVPTPGSDDRGARRIVSGEGGELYWTADHYRSFARIER